MTKKEREEKQKILDYYYSIRNRVYEAELSELNGMIKVLKQELKNET